MKKIVFAAGLSLLAACASLPDSVKGPFARSAQGSTAADTVEQSAAASPYPAVTDQGKF
jgi:starvation-inducible outer membrane lipoprotein